MNKPRLLYIAIPIGVLLGILLIAFVYFSQFFVDSNAWQFLSAYNYEKVEYNSAKHLEYEDLLNADIAGDVDLAREDIDSVLVVNTSETVQMLRKRHQSPFLKTRGKTFDSTKSDTFERVGTTRLLTCTATGQEAEEVPVYFTQYNAIVFGGGWSRSAQICGDEYVLYEYDDPIGHSQFGPFKLR